MDNRTIYAVYGKSGFGREVMPIIAEQFCDEQDSVTLFLDDEKTDEVVNGHSVWTFDELEAHSSLKKRSVIAIADGKVRERLATRCAAANIGCMSVVATNHVRMDNCMVGEGAIFCPFTTLTSNIVIGVHFQCNIYSYIAHDCVIGDFVTFAPGVKCNGNVHIEDHAYIGTGAILKQGTSDMPLRIGRGAVVGMGAVVTKDVAPGAIVVGNPARPLAK
ncbi:MAG: acetyltransferase [Parasphingorhabdus sp.]|uniref:acetyltransferase n=1 Tax=Parasphingorhabdus sp. TaxID=2709688 RepID=UPI003296F059